MNEPEYTDVRSLWLEATRKVSMLETELFQPGNGYGCPEAKEADLHRLQSARLQVDRLFTEYQDVDRRAIDDRLYALQRSQTRATWASFSVGAVVGTASLLSVIISLLN